MGGKVLPAPPLRGVILNFTPGATVKMALSGSSATIALITGVHYRLWSDVVCFIKLGGDTATAGVTSMPLAAQDKEWITPPGDKKWLAGIVASGTGNLYVTDMEVQG